MASCTYCGTETRPDSGFCLGCGMALSSDAAASPAGEPDGREAERLFVGRHYDFIRKSWEMAEHRSPKRCWNWYAFLFSFSWLGYRKMYRLAWVVIFAHFFLNLGVDIYTMGEEESQWGAWLVSLGIQMAIALALGFFGMPLYQQHVKRRIADIQAKYGPEQAWAELARQGGTNFWSIFGMLFFWILLAGVVSPLILFSLSA